MRLLFCLVAFSLVCNVSRADLLGIDGQPIPHSEPMLKQLESARESLANSNLEECRTRLHDLAKNHPDCPHPEIILSNWLLEGGYRDQARQVMEQLSVEDPMRMDVHLWFAKLAVSEGRLFDASSHLQLIQHQHPPETWSAAYRRAFLANVQKSRAQVAAMRGEWKSATKVLTKLIEGGFDDADVRLSLGQALFAQNDVAGAEEHLRKAADLAPNRVVTELILAELHDGIGNDEEAEQWFRKSIERSEDRALLDVNIQRAAGAYAAWLLRKNRPDDTLRTVQVFSASEGPASHRMLRAFALQMNGDYESSASILAELSQNDPGNILVANRLALALVESEDEGKRGRALQIAKANIKLAPQSINVACSLAWIQFRLGDLNAASHTASAVLKAGGQLDRDSAYFLAEILNALGRVQAASELRNLAASGHNEFYYQARLDDATPSRVGS
ncbi:MAG: tetratricopeptide repeat protein [Aureliella sp.]